MIAVSTPNFTLDAVFESMADLPVFPKVVHKALQVLDDPKKKISDVSEIIKFDQGLVANILKLTNSAIFGLRQQVTDLDTALALLGNQKIREVLVAGAAMPYLSRPLSGYEMAPEDLWLHSMSCAVVSGVISKRIGFTDSSTLFTTAILHDIGKIVLDIYVGPRLGEVLMISKQRGNSFSEAEWSVLGTDHAVAGAAILTNWDFPPDICRAVRNHHDPDLYIQDRLSACLALSNIMSIQLGFGVGTDGFRYHISPALLKAAGCGQEDYYWCMDHAITSFYEAEKLLNMIMD